MERDLEEGTFHALFSGAQSSSRPGGPVGKRRSFVRRRNLRRTALSVSQPIGTSGRVRCAKRSKDWFQPTVDDEAVVVWSGDACVFRLTSLDRKRVRVIVGVYIDDLIVTEEAEYCEKLRTNLEQVLPTKNLGALSYCTGCLYSRDYLSGTLKITQTTACIDRLGGG